MTAPHARFPTAFLAAVLCGIVTTAPGQDAAFAVDTIPTPPGLDPQVGGLTFFPDGRLAICCHRGEVYVYDPRDGRWTLFADGLQEPLGIVAEDDATLVVMQRPELTRLSDTDGDGRADLYRTICDDFGVSGNYHEFAFGPAVGPDGRYYVGLNTASNGAGIRDEIRGEFRKLGRPGRMYACVPWRGWVVAIDPTTGELDAHACGFRSPDGLGFGPDGALYVTDNQGDWLGTSKLYRVVPGGFHGHVSSLVWRPDWDRGDPLALPVEELDAMRTRAAVLFPHGIVANSPTQPVWIPETGAFEPFAGQLLVGEMNSPRIVRVMLEDVAGTVQGATVTLLENSGLPGGVHRMAFDADGTLWTGHTALSWAGGKGLRRIRWTGVTPFEVERVTLTDDGFRFRFTQPVDPATVTPRAFEVESYWYAYHRAYGSDRMDPRPVEVTAVALGDDRRTVDVTLAALRSGRVHQFRLSGPRAADGAPLGNALVCYTLDRLRDGTAERPQWLPKEPPAPPRGEPTALAAGETAVLQAESAQLVAGPAIDKRHAGYRGTGYVDYANPRDDRVAFVVTAARDQRYAVRLRYALAGGDRPLQLEVDGKAIGKPIRFAPTGDWDRWGEHEPAPEIRLTAGEHTIALVAIGNSGPNLDEVRLEPIER